MARTATTFSDIADKQMTEPAKHRCKRRRRLAVARVMRNVIGEESLADALTIWRHEFDKLDNPDPINYVSRVRKMLIDPRMRQPTVDQLAREFIKAARNPDESGGWQAINDDRQARPRGSGAPKETSAPDTQQAPDNGVAPPESAKRRNDTPARPTAERSARSSPSHPGYVVFNKLASVALARLGPERAVAACRWVASEHASVATTKAARRAESAWLESVGRQPVTDALARPELANLVHGLYVWTAEHVGPVKADRIFGAAIEETERLPEAERFDPRKLL